MFTCTQSKILPKRVLFVSCTEGWHIFFFIGKDGISYIWRSILKGTDLLKDGVVDQSGKWKQLGYMGRSVATTELVSSMTDHP
jgi:hypothetical protein